MEIFIAIGFIIFPIIICILSCIIDGKNALGFTYGALFIFYYFMIKSFIKSAMFNNSLYLKYFLIGGLSICVYYGFWVVIKARIKKDKEK